MPFDRSNEVSTLPCSIANHNGRASTGPLDDPTLLRTQGELEASVCEVLRRYSLEYLGRGPKDIRAYLLGDLLLVRMYGVLTLAEQQLANSKIGNGKSLLKQVRSQLIETARKELELMITNCTGVHVISLHHDISTETAEEVVIFTLEESPALRVTKRK